MVCGLFLAENGFAEEVVPAKAGLAAGEPQSESGGGEGRDASDDVDEEEEGFGAVKDGATTSVSPALGAEAGGDGDGGVEGRRRGDETGQSDADFDDLLASYLVRSDRTDGHGDEEGRGEREQGGDAFGKAGGSLLMPLGALRLLR